MSSFAIALAEIRTRRILREKADCKQSMWGTFAVWSFISGVTSFFCLQVNGPITEEAYKWGCGGGAYKRRFTVAVGTFRSREVDVKYTSRLLDHCTRLSSELMILTYVSG